MKAGNFNFTFYVFKHAFMKAKENLCYTPGIVVHLPFASEVVGWCDGAG